MLNNCTRFGTGCKFLGSVVIAVFLFLFLISAGALWAQTDFSDDDRDGFVDNQTVDAPAEEEAGDSSVGEISDDLLLDEAIQLEELGARRTWVLPGNPLHFFKRFGRGVKEAFTFDTIKKAEVKLQHANQELAEIRLLFETDPDILRDEDLFEDALVRFGGKLSEIEGLADDLKRSEDDLPRLDQLLDELVGQQIKQQKFLNSLSADFLQKTETVETEGKPIDELQKVAAKIESAKAAAAASITKTVFSADESPQKVGERLNKALRDEEGSAFNGIWQLAILESIGDNAPEEIKTVIDSAKKNTIKHFEEKILEVPADVRVDRLKNYVSRSNSGEIRLFKLLDEIKNTADIPRDVLSKLEEVKEIVARRFETRLAEIDDPEIEEVFFHDFRNENIDELAVLEDFKNRLNDQSELSKKINEAHENSIKIFKDRFMDAKSQEQAELFRRLSREMRENPSPKTFKLISELEKEVLSDPEKRAFLNQLKTGLQAEIEDNFRREGEIYIERYVSLDPNDIAVFDSINFDSELKDKFLSGKTEKLKKFAQSIEDPGEFDRFYDRFYNVPEEVINQIKGLDPEFQQALQVKFRKIEERRSQEERERNLSISSLDYQEKEIFHQADRLERQKEEEFFRRLQAIPWENFDERKKLWEEKNNSALKRLDERMKERRDIFTRRLKLDPFGCDDVCQEIQLSFLEQDYRHERERLRDELERERRRIESERSQFEENNPLAGRCDSPESCEDYCFNNRNLPECAWLVYEVENVDCGEDGFWNEASQRCMYFNEPIEDCPQGEYWNGTVCAVDPYYRSADYFEPEDDYRDCGHGDRWSEIEQRCLPFEFRECGPGFYFDFVTRRCEQEYRQECADDEYWDSVRRACLSMHTLSCPIVDPKPCGQGFYREPYQNESGCWLPGECMRVENLCPEPPVECPEDMEREEFTLSTGCVEYSECRLIEACPRNDFNANTGTTECNLGLCSGGCEVDQNNCPISCKSTRPAVRCGDGICQSVESGSSCPVDCGGEEEPRWQSYIWRFKDGETAQSSILARIDQEYTNYISQVAAECLLINKSQFFWRPGAGNDSSDNWRNFGIPDCSTTLPNVQCGSGLCEGGETRTPTSTGPAVGCWNTPSECVSESVCTSNGNYWCNNQCYGNAASCDVCGDDICSSGETVSSCSSDCLDSQCAGSPYFCRDQESCLARDSYWCNGRCETSACSGGGATCGNGRCELGETATGCPGDCGSTSQCSTTPSYCSTESACAGSGFYWCNGSCFGAACGESCNNNGTCDNGETIASCPADCQDSGDYCGDGWIYSTETRSCVRQGVVCSNPSACDACRSGSTSSYCEWNNDGCPVSCRSSSEYCGNNVCSGTENSFNCPADCSGSSTACNNNGVCEGGESYGSCPSDCGGSSGSTCVYYTRETCMADSACQWDDASSFCSSNWSGGDWGSSCSCPSGYHYHGDSGSYCMNDAENYSGTCYTCDGTSTMSCPVWSGGGNWGGGSSCGSYNDQSTCESTTNCHWESGSNYCYYDDGGGGSYGTCSSSDYSGCYSISECESYGWSWCSSSNYCYSPNTGYTCGSASTSFAPQRGSTRFSQADPLYRLARGVGEFVKFLFTYVGRAAGGF